MNPWALLDRPPHIHWYRDKEVIEDLEGEGFQVVTSWPARVIRAVGVSEARVPPTRTVATYLVLRTPLVVGQVAPGEGYG